MFFDICLMMFLMLIMFSFMLIYFGVYFLSMNLKYFIDYYIFSLNSSQIVMTFYIDWMTLIFMSVVLFISSFVIYYSKFYMMDDININRFICLVLLFIMSMILLIISPNLISILLGWDGLGLISYCLVIYYQNIKSFNAGMMTVLMNRLGDVFLLLSIAWMMNFGSWNYIFYVEFLFNNNEMLYIFMFIILASFTKSAQIPFSSWLPAAMAAPTPVSSLVHSSTLVTAGVYLLIRFENLFKLNNNLVYFFLIISLLTMFMSGLNANFENDLKKIIALSTLSQLGLMMSILFLGFGNLAFFHLLTHALFKALLFMCAGIYIHCFMSFQDIRLMGSINKQMPFVSLTFLISNLSLCGFPFLSGFYSKDLILESLFMLNLNMFILIIFILSTLLTVSYTFRLIFYLMSMNYNFFSLNFLSESIWGFNKSLIGLLLMVIFGGCLLSWMIFPYPLMINLTKFWKLMPLMILFLGIILGFFLYYLNFNIFYYKLVFYKMFFTSMWFLPIIFTGGLLNFWLKSSMLLMINMDQSWTEFIMGKNVLKLLNNYSSFIDLLLFHFGKFIILLFLLILMMFMIF